MAISNSTPKVIEHADVLDRLDRTEYTGMVRVHARLAFAVLTTSNTVRL